jgi:hypothetical protein
VKNTPSWGDLPHFGSCWRKELWVMRHPEHEENQVAQAEPPEIGYKKPPKQERAFAADTSKATGEAKSSINRHISRADALGDDP